MTPRRSCLLLAFTSIACSALAAYLGATEANFDGVLMFAPPAVVTFFASTLGLSLEMPS